MKRVYLTDWSGRWFDIDKAQAWEERTIFNGQYMVSLATNSRFRHETLYRTASGRWVVNRRFDWHSVPDKWETITEEEAAKWLAVNGYEPPDELRDKFLHIFIEHFATDLPYDL